MARKKKLKFTSSELGLLSLFGSLAFHVGVMMTLAYHRGFKVPPPTPKIEITVIEIEKRAPAPPIAKIEEPKPAPPPKDNTQIVAQDQKPTPRQKPNKEAKYLGAKNNKVAKETTAKKAGAFKNAEKEKDETVTTDKSDVAQEQASSQTDDYLKDVAAGMQTMLNTQEFAYYNYYQAIKEKVKKHWEPIIGERIHLNVEQGRQPASNKEHMTRLLLIIDKTGQLAKIDIVGGSGLKDADIAALEAFKKAAPFGAPPKGLINAAGEVRMRWDLVLESLDQN